MRWWEALLQFWTASGDRRWGVVVSVQSLFGVARTAGRGGPEAGEGARGRLPQGGGRNGARPPESLCGRSCGRSWPGGGRGVMVRVTKGAWAAAGDPEDRALGPGRLAFSARTPRAQIFCC